MPEPVQSEPRSVVSVTGVSRRFADKVALDNVSLEVPRGCVFGLIGENGAGKTTLIKHMLGSLRAQSGQVRVFGMDPVAHPVQVLGRIGYLSEDRDLPNWMSLRELMNHTRAFFPNWDDAYAAELVRQFDLDVSARVEKLSRGQRARAGLLLALAHRPELLVLDEPSSGLDPVVRRDILGAVIRTVADQGRTVLFSSHLLDEVERVADRIAILHRGRIVMESALDDVKDAHRRVTLRFEAELDRPPALLGAISCDGRGQEWTYVCVGPGSQVRNAAQSIGATVVAEATMTLDEIFVSRVRE